MKWKSDARNLQAREALAMADGAVIALAAAILEVEELRPAELLDDLGNDLGALERGTVFEIGAFATKEDFRKSDFRARLAVELLDFDDVTSSDAVLFTACFEN